MGKGSRNRQIHQQDKAENPQKNKPKKVRKPMPKWLTVTICAVLLFAVVFGVGAYIFNRYGIIERNRIIIESKTGEFDVTQQIATYVAWQNIYYEANMEWMYMKYGFIEDTYGVTKQNASTYIPQEQYALAMAQTYMQTNMRDAIDASLDTLKELVAVCDEAYVNNITLNEVDEKSVQDSIDSLTNMAMNYNFFNLTDFLSQNMFFGMRESDIKAAIEMSTLYNKYKTLMQVEFEMAITPADLIAFRDAHPEDFFKMDYLTFTTNNETLAKDLTAGTVLNADQFKELILEDHFKNNYKTAYNKYVTQAEVTADYNSIKKLSDSAEKKELSDKLDELGVESVKTYEASADNDEALEKWLFDTARKQYDTTVLTNKAADGIYLVAFYSAAANKEAVEARVLFRSFVDGDSYGEDTDFKTNILTYLKERKKDSTNFPKVTYKDSTKKGNELKDACEALATNDEKKALLEANGAKKVLEVTIDATEDVVPATLRDQLATLAPETADKIYVINDGAIAYVVYILSVDLQAERYDILYATVDADPYYQIIEDLTVSLNKIYPTEKTTNLTVDPKENTFEAWISERGESAITSARKEFDKKYFSSSTKDKDGKVTYTYTVYMVINKPMYLDESLTVSGGYIPFYGKVNGLTATQQAENALAKMQGKTYAAAIAVMNSLADSANNISPTISATITKESLTSYAQLKKWFFEEERNPNDMAVVGTEGKNEIYLALYTGEGPAWENQAKESAVTERTNNWVTGLMASYTVNVDALDAIGEPTTTAAAPTAQAAIPSKWEL